MKKADVIQYFKTQKAVSQALTNAGYPISQPAVCKWGETIPELPARVLSEITDGDLVFDKSIYRVAPRSAA